MGWLFENRVEAWTWTWTSPRWFRQPRKVAPAVHVNRALSSVALSLAVLLPLDFPAFAYDWDLLNGKVTVEEPLNLRYRDRSTGKDISLQLHRPQIIGAGSGGAVVAFDDHDFLLKISWEGTAKTVRRECTTLQLLEDRGVEASEKCLAVLDYPNPNKEEEPRSMILVVPYMRDAVASINDVATESARRRAVDQIARTLVQMLAANIITIDVQPLISRTTGQTIFIDMTEAQVLSNIPTSTSLASYSFLDQTLISSFASEMVALIPEAYWRIAKASTVDELQQIQERHGDNVAQQLKTLLNDQTPFLTIDG